MHQSTKNVPGYPSSRHQNHNPKRRSVSSTFRRVHLNAAGIDIGSREHYVAVPPGRDTETVRRFGCLTPDLHEMARWLKACRIETVAMESTAVYWIPVVQVLEQYGIETVLVDAAHVKNVAGRKTDVSDCQWIQELHTYGLLRGAFRPGKQIEPLRAYWRQREDLVAACARQIQLMHKAMEQMNVQLHKVLSDISGLSGMRIIRAILGGQRGPHELAALCHQRVQADADTVAKALTGDYHEHHLFALQQAVETYDFHQQQLTRCDAQIEQYMARTFPARDLPAGQKTDPPKPRRAKPRKNQVHFDLRRELHRITGVDLTRIESIDALTAQTVICECGFDMSRFPTEGHFVSWLGLCPNNRITGGRIRSRRTRNVHNRAADALRLAAQTLHKSQSALGAYYRRMRARLGAPKAITATAHKLARIIYRLLKYGEAYVSVGQQAYEEQHRQRRLRSLQRMASDLGCQLVMPAVSGSVS